MGRWFRTGIIANLGPHGAGSCFLLAERWRRFRRRPENARELPPLQELPPLAAAAADLVFRRADGLLRAAARFDRKKVTIAGRGEEAEHPVVFRRQLDQDHAPARAREKIHFVCVAQKSPRGGRW